MRYKIVLVPFPFDDLSGTKVRPAICLTNEISTYRHVVIAFITSQVSKANENTDIVLKIHDKNFNHTGLKVSSAIRLHRLITIPTNLILRQLGVLPSDYYLEISKKVKELFDL